MRQVTEMRFTRRCFLLVLAAFTLTAAGRPSLSVEPSDDNAVASVGRRNAPTEAERCPGTIHPRLTCEAISAHAAEQQATWSLRAFFALLVTLIASAWAAWAATKAAVAADRSVKVAEDTAKRQLRAYVMVEPGGINIAEDGLHRVPFNLINNGQTPAYDLEHGGDFLIVTGDPREFDPRKDGRLGEAVATTDAILGPHTNRFTYAYLEEELCKPFVEAIAKREAAIVHYGFIRYKDAFGEERQTNFAFYHSGPDLSDLQSKRCRLGNHAT